MKKQIILIALSTILFSIQASAQLIDYYIVVHTKDVVRGGTDNTVYMNLYGTKGNTGRFVVKGDKERDDKDEFRITKFDVGNITKLVVDVSGDLADKWDLDYVMVTKNSDEHIRNHSGGYYEFRPNKEMSYDPESFTPSYKKDPRVVVNTTKVGTPITNRAITTITNFAINKSSQSNRVMSYQETWGEVESVGVSTEDATTMGASVTLTYESPETVAGKFGAEATASFENMISEVKSSTFEKSSSRTYDWGYDAPPGVAIFKKATFEIPYKYQEYKVGTEKIYVRNLNAEIRPVGLDDIQPIPQKDASGKVIPIKWSVIEDEYLKYADPVVQNEIINRYKKEWLQKGYVYMGFHLEGFHRIETPQSQRIHVETPTVVCERIKDGAHSAMWEFVPISGNTCYIKNRWRKSNLFMMDAKIQADSRKGSEAQWEVTKQNNGTYLIRNVRFKFQYLGMVDGKISYGRTKYQWSIKEVGW
ncbi:MAG: PLAT/LH2 domain-containing protein [Bacteroidota bacterium]